MTYRVDVAALGETTREIQSMGIAYRVRGPISGRAATELAVDALEAMVEDHGVLGPRNGIRLLRLSLGLEQPSQPTT